MLQFFNSHLAGPAMCSALQRASVATTPAIVWFDTYTPDTWDDYGLIFYFIPSAEVDSDKRIVHVHLRPICYFAKREPGTLSAALWRTVFSRTLEALHELGAPAVAGTGSTFIEVDDCSDAVMQQMHTFAKQDPRLGQPAELEGFLATYRQNVIERQLSCRSRIIGLRRVTLPFPQWVDEDVAAGHCGGQISLTDALTCLGFDDARTDERLVDKVRHLADSFLLSGVDDEGSVHESVRWGDLDSLWQVVQSSMAVAQFCSHGNARGICRSCDELVNPPVTREWFICHGSDAAGDEDESDGYDAFDLRMDEWHEERSAWDSTTAWLDALVEEQSGWDQTQAELDELTRFGEFERKLEMSGWDQMQAEWDEWEKRFPS